MPRTPAAQAPPETPADPLADLREPDDEQAPPPPQEEQQPEGEQEAAELRPMVSEEMHGEMVAEAIAAMHADPTVQGFVHGGGQCGCRYIAGVVLRAAVPVALDAPEEDGEES